MSVDAGEHSHGSTESIGLGGGGGVGGVGGVGAAASLSAYFDGSYNVGNTNGISDGHVFTFGSQRQIAQEEKVLAKVLYRMTNKLMTLNDKNMQVNIYIELYRNTIKVTKHQQHFCSISLTVWHNLRSASAVETL